MPAALIDKYLESRALNGPWRIEGCCSSGFAGAVIIPAMAESCNLFDTLDSLACNPQELLQRFLVLVVANHKEGAASCDSQDNLATLKLLRNDVSLKNRINLAWVDAASPGRELPTKGGGVGMARKLGHDLALSVLDYTAADPLLISLDADTLVRSDYLPAITNHFQQNKAGGGVIPFLHQGSDDPETHKAIERYELFLRSYVYGLMLAGSPYGFHTVGSAMACTASAYLKIAGMNCRSAGEDFYFLQQLARTTGVAHIKGTVVFPSPRPSHRVPFGTGRSVSRLLQHDAEAVLFYRADCFKVLAEWLALVKARPASSGVQILRETTAISPSLEKYLDQLSFVDTWDKLRRNNRSPASLQKAFDGWFDGLRTMKLIHYLSDELYPRGEPDQSLPELLIWGGEAPVYGIAQQLAALRRIEQLI